MRTPLLFSVLVSIAVSGCGNTEHSRVPEDTTNTESSDDLFYDDVPYHLVETMDDGSKVVQFCVEVMMVEMQAGTDDNGKEEVYKVNVPIVEEHIATVPPGEDISAFLLANVDGRIINPRVTVPFDVEPAPGPPKF